MLYKRSGLYDIMSGGSGCTTGLGRKLVSYCVFYSAIVIKMSDDGEILGDIFTYLVLC